MQLRCTSWAIATAAGMILGLGAWPTAAATFTVDMERTDGGGILAPGESFTFAIRGYLTDTDNEGLAFFLYDLEVVNGPAPINLETAVVQGPGVDMDPFVPDWGYAHAFNGTPSADDLLQAGGAQNTIQNDPTQDPGLPPFPSGPVILGVGHDPGGVVLHEGTLTLPGGAPEGTYTFRIKPGSLLGNVVAAYDGVHYTVAAADTVIGTGITFDVGTGSCATVEDCGDTDANGIVDDPCMWYSCDAGTCNAIARSFGDAGGPFGACPPDTFANIHDRNHTLACFSGVNTCDDLNMDLGGAFGDCPPDGFCNIHDANHALAVFSGTNTCTCPPSPSPALQHSVVGSASLRATADRKVIRPGEEVSVDLVLLESLKDLRGYQLDVAVSGGRRGRLELVDINITERRDHAFTGLTDTFEAFNTQTGKMLCGLESSGVATAPGAYLATFTYRATRDAAGTFVVDVSPKEGTYLIASHDGEITVAATTPAIVVVATSPGPGR